MARTDDSSSDGDRMVAVINEVLTRPGDFLKQGDTQRSFSKEITALGSGFVVTPDGYLLTNAHVVKPDKDDLEKVAIESIGELVQADVEAWDGSLSETVHRHMTDEAKERLQEAIARFYAKNIDANVEKAIYAVLPSASDASDTAAVTRTCEIKAVGEPTPGKDVAVLKMEGADYPTLPLAAKGEASAREGAELLVLGYPGKVSLETSFTLRSRLQPSLNIGHISGTKEMEGGWHVIQTDATINPGNSGGPAMNDRGDVIGLATFGLKESQNLNYAISIDVARQFLRDLNVTPQQSNFTRSYNRALAEYAKPDHGNAVQMLTQLHNSHAEIGAVTDLLKQASYNQEAGAESSTGISVRSPVPVPLLVVGGVIILAVVLLVVLARR